MTGVNWTNVTDFQGLLASANTTTSGWFWTGAVFMIFVIVLISIVTFGFEVAVLSAAFISILLSILLLYMGLVPLWVVGVFVGLALTMFLYLIWSTSQEAG